MLSDPLSHSLYAASSRQRDAHVIIVGGGIIGVACADALARRGVKVLVIERGELGHGCSFGNAGWITPCFALPLAMPGMLLKSIKWILDPSSPFHIEPKLSLSLGLWLFRFLRSMNQKTMERAAAALIELASASLKSYQELAADERFEFGFSLRGLLMVAQTSAGLCAARRDLNLVQRYGIEGQDIDEAGVRAIEPAITGGPIEGGVFFPNEAHCEPLAAVAALAQRARLHGAEFRTGVELLDLVTNDGVISGLLTSQGLLKADQYVLATGAWSSRWGSRLGIRIPMMSGKGYAITVTGIDPPPSTPLMLLEKKCAITPRANSVRIAGTLELTGLNDAVNPTRLKAMAGSAAGILSTSNSSITHVWRGLRPCTADGVPMIGRPKKCPNLIVAVGHQMLGLLTAPATGTLVADCALSQKASFNSEPYAPDRFAISTYF